MTRAISVRPTKTVTIRTGLAGVHDTLAIMAGLVRAGKGSIAIRETALNLVSPIPPKNYLSEVAAIHAFVRDKIRYVRDPFDLETIAEPWITLDLKQGDCDDKAVLAASLLASIGFPVVLKAVGFRPGHCSHVLLAAQVPGVGWVDVETTEPVPLGWAPPNVKTTVLMGCQ